MQTEQQPLMGGLHHHHHHHHHHSLQSHQHSRGAQAAAAAAAAAAAVAAASAATGSGPSPIRGASAASSSAGSSSSSSGGSIGVGIGSSVGGSGRLCVGCGSPIQDQYILRVAPDLEWHASCLKCVECGIFLDENCTCFVRDGKTFCRRDYVRLFGAKCDKCGSGFSRSDFVMRAKSKIYHIECFRCALCQRQLVPGDEFALRDDGNLFCKDDHDQTSSNNNNNNISNQNNNNHSTSSSSATAALSVPTGIGSGSLLQQQGGHHHPHHHHHHHSHHHSLALLEAKSEHHNQSSNSSSGTVTFMPNIKCHSNSFRNCLIESNSGRHSRANSNDSHSDSSDTCITTSTSRKEGADRVRGSGGGSKGDRSGGMSGVSMSGGGGGGSDGKPTRVRTVLNEKQLHTLRTCYAANPRPDALMKEQLVEMTGLSPRVIRVWFQNKRCKDKKKAILMKQIQQQEKDGRKLGFGSMQGIPLVASSPVRHGETSPGGGVGGVGSAGGVGGGGVGGGGINPVDVHAYAPPWKALTEFALHNDLERIDPSAPHFQQLINQMHGYDIHGPPDTLSHHHVHHLHQQHHLGGPMDSMSMGNPHQLHPHGGIQQLQPIHSNDPSDQFVQFLDSGDEDSMQHDGQSP